MSTNQIENRFEPRRCFNAQLSIICVVFAVLVMCVFLVTINPEAAVASDGSRLVVTQLTTQANAAIDESEPNDEFGNATIIPMNTSVYGRCSAWTGAAFDTNDQDMFKVTLPQSGACKLTFTNGAYEKSAYNADELIVDIYNKYYEKVASYSYTMHSTRPVANTLSLSKGVNYIRVYRTHYNEDNHPYHFKLAYDIPATTISKVSSAKRAFTAKWTKKSGAAKYQLRYSTKKGMSGAKTVDVSKTKGSKKITGLKFGKKYYVQVRVVKSIGGEIYYSPWSLKKSLKTK